MLPVANKSAREVVRVEATVVEHEGGTVLRPVEMKVGVTSRYDSRGASDGACASTEDWLIANPAQARGVPGSQGTFIYNS